MTDYIDVAIAAIPVVNTSKLNPDDRNIPGVYSVMVVKGLSKPTAASAALDAFHSNCAVSMLDDFMFYVFDPRTGQVLDEDEEHESYSKTHLGRDIQYISAELPRIYVVTVFAEGQDGTASEVGTVTVAVGTELAATQAAINLLWDARLDTAGCTSRCHVELAAEQEEISDEENADITTSDWPASALETRYYDVLAEWDMYHSEAGMWAEVIAVKEGEDPKEVAKDVMMQAEPHGIRDNINIIECEEMGDSIETRLSQIPNEVALDILASLKDKFQKGADAAISTPGA